MTSVAVAVKGGGSSGSRRAVNWAVENLMPKADRFVLVHVIPKITSIPTPCIYMFFLCSALFGWCIKIMILDFSSLFYLVFSRIEQKLLSLHVFSRS